MELNIDIEDLKREVAQHEGLIQKYAQKARTVFFFLVVGLLFSLYSLFVSQPIISLSFFIMSLILLREYNKTKSLEEVHIAIQKFLKLVLFKEQIGDDSIPGFLQ